MGQESRGSLQSRGTGTPLLVLPTVFIRDLGSDLQHHCSELGRVDRLSPPHLVLPLGFSPAPLSGTYFARGLASLPASAASGLQDRDGSLSRPGDYPGWTGVVGAPAAFLVGRPGPQTRWVERAAGLGQLWAGCLRTGGAGFPSC